MPSRTPQQAYVADRAKQGAHFVVDPKLGVDLEHVTLRSEFEIFEFETNRLCPSS